MRFQREATMRKSRRTWATRRTKGVARSYLAYRNQLTGEVGLPWQGLVMMSLLLNGTAMSYLDIASDLYGAPVKTTHPIYTRVQTNTSILEAWGYVVASGGRSIVTLWLPTKKGREEFDLAMRFAEGKSGSELSDSDAFLIPPDPPKKKL
jgi:hypothetical protein